MSNELTPLLCVHGIGDAGTTWDPIACHLASTHRLITPTLPGHYGGPPLERARPTIPQLVDHLEKILDQADVDTAHVVGNSLGGWLAIELMARGRARSLVALSPAGGWPRSSFFETTLIRRMRIFHLLARKNAPLLEQAIRSRSVRRLLFRDVSADAGKLSRVDVSAFAQRFGNCPDFNTVLSAVHRERLPQVYPHRVPTVIAWGEQDHLLPADINEPGFHALLPGARFVRIPGVGHVPMLDDPAAVAQTILATTSVVDAE